MGKTTYPVKSTPEQIRADLFHTRAELTRTLDEIHGKLNPAALKQQAIEQFEEARQRVKEELREDLQTAKARFKEEAQEAKTAVREATVGKVETMYHSAQQRISDAGRSLVDDMKENPMPYALIGAGIGWLLVSRRRERTERIQYGVPEERGLIASAKEAATGTAERIGELAGEAKEGIASTASQVVDRVSEVAQEAKTGAQELAHRASDLTQQKVGELRSRTADLFESNPLAVGAAFVAIGAAIGMAFPSTRKERQLLGEAGEGVIEKARQVARGAIDKAEETARTGMEQEPQYGEPASGGEPDREGPEGGGVIPPPFH